MPLKSQVLQGGRVEDPQKQEGRLDWPRCILKKKHLQEYPGKKPNWSPWTKYRKPQGTKVTKTDDRKKTQVSK